MRTKRKADAKGQAPKQWSVFWSERVKVRIKCPKCGRTVKLELAKDAIKDGKTNRICVSCVKRAGIPHMAVDKILGTTAAATTTTFGVAVINSRTKPKKVR